MQEKICWHCKNLVRLEKPLEVGERVVLGVCQAKMEVYYVGKKTCENFATKSFCSDYIIFRDG